MPGGTRRIGKDDWRGRGSIYGRKKAHGDVGFLLSGPGAGSALS